MAALPHRYPMLLVDRVETLVPDQSIVAIKAVTINEGFFDGHFPGRPIMPGVIMVEAAAQLSSFYVKKIVGVEGFFGFAGIEEAKFRQTVAPGQRLLLLGKLLKYNPRRFSFGVQGMVNDTMVFEVVVSGMKV